MMQGFSEKDMKANAGSELTPERGSFHGDPDEDRISIRIMI